MYRPEINDDWIISAALMQPLELPKYRVNGFMLSH